MRMTSRGSDIARMQTQITSAAIAGSCTPGVARPPLKPRPRVKIVQSTSGRAGQANHGRFFSRNVASPDAAGSSGARKSPGDCAAHQACRWAGARRKSASGQEPPSDHGEGKCDSRRPRVAARAPRREGDGQRHGRHAYPEDRDESGRQEADAGAQAEHRAAGDRPPQGEGKSVERGGDPEHESQLRRRAGARVPTTRPSRRTAAPPSIGTCGRGARSPSRRAGAASGRGTRRAATRAASCNGSRGDKAMPVPAAAR